MTKVNFTDHLQMVRDEFVEDFHAIPWFETVMNQWIALFQEVGVDREKPALSQYNGEFTEETYAHYIVFPNGTTFEFEWDIVLAMDWLRKREVKIIDIPICSLLPFMEKNETAFLDTEQKAPQHPIIVVKSCLVGQEVIVLNGNHRIREASLSGKTTVKGYYLPNNRHREWMTSDEMRSYYEFSMDFQIMEKLLEDIHANEKVDFEGVFRNLQISKRLLSRGGRNM